MSVPIPDSVIEVESKVSSFFKDHKETIIAVSITALAVLILLFIYGRFKNKKIEKLEDKYKIDINAYEKNQEFLQKQIKGNETEKNFYGNQIYTLQEKIKEMEDNLKQVTDAYNEALDTIDRFEETEAELGKVYKENKQLRQQVSNGSNKTILELKAELQEANAKLTHFKKKLTEEFQTRRYVNEELEFLRTERAAQMQNLQQEQSSAIYYYGSSSPSAPQAYFT